MPTFEVKVKLHKGSLCNEEISHVEAKDYEEAELHAKKIALRKKGFVAGYSIKKIKKLYN